MGKPLVLSIAGFDPSAGAGALADVKTFESNGVYGFSALSALTWQNDVEFDRVEWIAMDKIIQQVQVLQRRFDVCHIKIGLVENANVLREIINFLNKSIDNPTIVFDPILRASAGFVFHQGDINDLMAVKGLYCMTPNIPEAERLFGKDDLHNKLLMYSHAVNIYLKGGHAENGKCVDVLFTKGHTFSYSNTRLPKGEKHGSGCVLSAALTAQLALGKNIQTAAMEANAYTHDFLASNDTLLGYHKPAHQ